MKFRDLFFSFITAFVFLLSTTVATLPVKAEEEIPYDEVLEAPNDGYIEPTYENLSKMYWAVGKFNREDDEAVDNYLQINECDLYRQYYTSDFDWVRIREATREHIQDKLSGMSNKFELVVPIELGRYDIEKEEFEVAEESKIRGIKNIDFNMNDHNRNAACGRLVELNGYPRNMIILLNRPLVLEKVPVKKEVAEFFLDEKEKENREKRRKVYETERGAFLRLKVDVLQYKDTIRVSSGSLRAVVYGRLEGYEIYADSAKIKPLYFYRVDDREARRRIRRKKTSAEEAGVSEKIQKISPRAAERLEQEQENGAGSDESEPPASALKKPTW